MLSDAPIVTPRLELRLLSRPVLSALAAERYDEVADLLPYGVSVDELHRLTWVAGFRERQLEEDEAVAPWLLRAIVLRTGDGAMVGHAGLHGPPEDGTVEIGYSVFEAHRRRGYAEEAARGLLDWAAAQDGVSRVRASVSPTNEPSLRMVAKLGLVETGRQWDDEDGEEIVFEAPLPLTQ